MKSLFVFLISILAAVIFLLVGWHRDPSYSTFPRPGMTIYFAVFGFVMASLLIFSANVILAISRGKRAKSEDELEAMVAPALQGRDYDERILTWTVYPRAIMSGLNPWNFMRSCHSSFCEVTWSKQDNPWVGVPKDIRTPVL